MRAKEIIKNVCIYLNKDEILNSEVFQDDGESLSATANFELNLMLECLNYVLEEISSEYLPIYKQKEITFTNNKCSISSIDSNIQDIVSVKTKYGKSIKYNIIEGNIVCIAKSAVITYSVYPQEINSLDSNINDFNGILSARVIAYGVASEFCFMQMLNTQASVWEIRYKNALLVDARKKGSLYLKGRGWF